MRQLPGGVCGGCFWFARRWTDWKDDISQGMWHMNLFVNIDRFKGRRDSWSMLSFSWPALSLICQAWSFMYQSLSVAYQSLFFNNQSLSFIPHALSFMYQLPQLSIASPQDAAIARWCVWWMLLICQEVDRLEGWHFTGDVAHEFVCEHRQIQR